VFLNIFLALFGLKYRIGQVPSSTYVPPALTQYLRDYKSNSLVAVPRNGQDVYLTQNEGVYRRRPKSNYEGAECIYNCTTLHS
jgi:hypothetical protein